MLCRAIPTLTCIWQELEQTSPVQDALHASEAFLHAGRLDQSADPVPVGWKVHSTDDKGNCCLVIARDQLTGCA